MNDATEMVLGGGFGRKVNLRTPEVLATVQAQVEKHYRSGLVDRLRRRDGVMSVAGMSIRLAVQFGFCYGVERAIDLAYAARKVYKDRHIYILGEIIHNPEVNDQIRAMGIKLLSGPQPEASMEDLTGEDVVIIPAFGTELSVMNLLVEKGCQLVDTTCGDVMSVWKRIRQYASEGVTSIIHGKAWHEETTATSSRALGANGHYLVVFTLEETDYVCQYIRNGGDKQEFLNRFKGAFSPGFDPEKHLQTVGVANQTTMLRNETEEVQHRIRQAMIDRYGDEHVGEHFRVFDTICGATQDRQDALEKLLAEPINLLIVIGGYNSSNTSHLAEMGEARLPTFFIKNAGKIVSDRRIVHFSMLKHAEIETDNWLPAGAVTIGITAGASCPNNLIEETIVRLYELKGVSQEQLMQQLETASRS
ncbi:MAG: 4-hydroxy-3-methylbut-2-enyl diphosphate reductase [Verrucomicrobiae bacterium]|nr:4-hydroxy-3-methylbut-2-enyl diphosphate reductase [Verrucomicrobiae bacterium]